MEKYNYTLKVYKDRKGEWRFQLRHKNGEIVMTSEEGKKSRKQMLLSLRRAARAIFFQEVNREN